MVPFGVDDGHELSVLRPGAGGSPKCGEEWRADGRRMSVHAPSAATYRRAATAAAGALHARERGDPALTSGRRPRHHRVSQAAQRKLEAAAARDRPERSRLEQLPPGALARAELGEDAARIGRPGVLPGPPEIRKPRSQLLVGSGRVEHAAHDELRRDRAVPAVLLQPERDVEATAGSEAGRADRPWPNAIAEPPSRPCWRTRKRRCFPSPTVLAAAASTHATRSVDSGLPRPNGASRSSSCARSSVSGSGGHDGVDGRHAAAGRRPRARRPRATANASANASSCSGCDREAGRCAVAAEPLEVVRARREAAVEVEVGNRAARSLPAVTAPRDEHDGTVEPLDEPGGDDPDHALVPLLAPEDVARGEPRLRRPGTRPSRSASRRIRSSTPCRSRFRSSSWSPSSRGRVRGRRSGGARARRRVVRGGRPR